jgi:secreted Zn-dependent insulinase-like peptidase
MQFVNNISVDIAQPLYQNHTFKHFEYRNMKVLLINPNNNNLHQTYISLSANVGSKSDPDNITGLTHLIEHLLFTGSQNF